MKLTTILIGLVGTTAALPLNDILTAKEADTDLPSLDDPRQCNKHDFKCWSDMHHHTSKATLRDIEGLPFQDQAPKKCEMNGKHGVDCWAQIKEPQAETEACNIENVELPKRGLEAFNVENRSPTPKKCDMNGKHGVDCWAQIKEPTVETEERKIIRYIGIVDDNAAVQDRSPYSEPITCDPISEDYAECWAQIEKAFIRDRNILGMEKRDLTALNEAKAIIETRNEQEHRSTTPKKCEMNGKHGVDCWAQIKEPEPMNIVQHVGAVKRNDDVEDASPTPKVIGYDPDGKYGDDRFWAEKGGMGKGGAEHWAQVNKRMDEAYTRAFAERPMDFVPRVSDAEAAENSQFSEECHWNFNNGVELTAECEERLDLEYAIMSNPEAMKRVYAWHEAHRRDVQEHPPPCFKEQGCKSIGS